MKKELYSVYALRVIGEQLFFYIGVTSQSVDFRFYMHKCSVRLGSDGNKKKSLIMSNNEGKIEVVVLKKVKTTKEMAHYYERNAINKYFKAGHPLTNREKKKPLPTKTLRLEESLVYDIKYYVAVNGGTITSFVDRAIRSALTTSEKQS